MDLCATPGLRVVSFLDMFAENLKRQHGASWCDGQMLLAAAPLVAGLAALPRSVPTFRAARVPVAVRAQEGRSPVELSEGAERDPRLEAIWEALWSDGLLGRLISSQKRALLPRLPSWLPGARKHPSALLLERHSTLYPRPSTALCTVERTDFTPQVCGRASSATVRRRSVCCGGA